MGWTDSHLHQFVIGNHSYKIRDANADFGTDGSSRNERTYSLRQVVPDGAAAHAGTFLHEQGTPLRVAQAQFGHSNVTTMLEVYGGQVGGRDRDRTGDPLLAKLG
jgi:hypothetical protein